MSLRAGRNRMGYYGEEEKEDVTLWTMQAKQ